MKRIIQIRCFQLIIELIVLLFLSVSPFISKAQNTVLTVSGVNLYISEKDTFFIGGKLLVNRSDNRDGTIFNNGKIFITDSIYNLTDSLFFGTSNPFLDNSTPPKPGDPKGTVFFNGNIIQYINSQKSNSILFNNLSVNNSSGVNLKNSIIVLGNVNLSKGSLFLNGKDLYLYYDRTKFYNYNGKIGNETNTLRIWDNTRISYNPLNERSGHIMAKFDEENKFLLSNIGIKKQLGFSCFPPLMVERGHVNLPYAADGSLRKYFLVKEDEANTSGFEITYLDSSDYESLNIKEQDFRLFKNLDDSPVSYEQADKSSVNTATNSVMGDVALVKDETSIITVADFNCKNPPRAYLQPAMNVCLGTQFEIRLDSLEKLSDVAVTLKWEWIKDGVPRTLVRNESQVFSDTLGSETKVIYTVTVTDSRSCFSSSSIEVTGLQVPVSAIEVKSLKCKDSPIKLSAKSELSDITYTWNMADGSPLITSTEKDIEHTYSSAGDYTVVLTSSKNNCSSATTQIITVNPLPEVDFSLNDLCNDWEFINITKFTPTKDNIIYASKWDFGDGEIVDLDAKDDHSKIAHKYSATGSRTVTLDVTSDKFCKSSMVKSVIIENQSVDFSINKNIICLGEKIVFTNSSKPKSTGTPTYTWNFGDYTTSNEVNPEKVYAEPGILEVSLSMQTGSCIDVITKSVTVKPNPDAKGINVFPFSICQGGSASFEPQVISSNSEYKWDILGETILEASPTRTFNSNGKIDVLLTVTSLGCSSKYKSTVNVEPKPKANFTFVSDCFGKPIQFYNQSSISEASLSYNWKFTDFESSTAVNPQFTYTASTGSEQASLIATSNKGCSDTIIKTVEIYEVPTITLNDIDYCDTSYALDATVTNVTGCTYVWDDGIKTPKRTADQSRYYSVIVTSDKNCKAEKTIKVNLGVDIDPGLPVSITFCGSGKLDAKYNDSMCIWQRPDGSSFSNSRVIIADQQGWYKVLVADQSCSARDSVYVTINSLPAVSLGNDVFECYGTNVTLDAGAGFTSYLWSTGQNTRTVVVNKPDEYAVKVRDNNGCENTDAIKVNLRALPQKPFTVDAISECKSAQLYAGSNTLSYLWKTGETSNIITANSSGDYWVKISDSYCSVYDTLKVNILQVDEVNLGPDIAICEGNQVVLNAGNHAASYTYVWDKQVSSSNLYTVTKAGRYICEIKNNSNGCSSTDDVFIRFNPSPRIDLGPDQSLCGASSLTLDAGNQGSTIQWGSDKGFISIQQIVNITEPDKYWVMVMNSFGCLAFDTIQIYPVSSNIIAQFISASKIFEGDTVVFKNMSYTEPYTSSWSFGDGASSTEEHPKHIYHFPSTFKVELTVTNGYCFSTISKPIIVLEDKRRIDKNGKRVGERYIEIISSKLYPNPAQGTISFEMELSDYADVVVGVFSIKGELISMEKIKQSLLISKQYYLSNLSPGIYILKVWVGSKSATYKIVKTR